MSGIYAGDALNMCRKLKSESIDCVITSPPYWSLRDYGIAGQLGLEKDFNEYIDKLIRVFNEIKRILKSTGTLWVNLGDTYSNSGGSGKNQTIHKQFGKVQKINKYSAGTVPHRVKSLPSKCLVQIPARFAIKMVDNGWILRNEIIWRKNNVMPSSAKDRLTVDFEKVFFFVKAKKYYFKQLFEPYIKPLNRWGGETLKAEKESLWDKNTGQKSYRNRSMRPNPKGRNKRTTWDINTKPFKGAHFAVFPEKLVEPMLEAGCPENGIVLDPFCGSGTVAVVAKRFNRRYVGFDLNPEYVKIAEERLMSIDKE